eukprot:m.76013 g.76013  ORF g.76013 m.76013 type:complete len:202 (-) comp8501_c0_seq3:718-1323(-)
MCFILYPPGTNTYIWERAKNSSRVCNECYTLVTWFDGLCTDVCISWNKLKELKLEFSQLSQLNVSNLLEQNHETLVCLCLINCKVETFPICLHLQQIVLDSVVIENTMKPHSFPILEGMKLSSAKKISARNIRRMISTNSIRVLNVAGNNDVNAMREIVHCALDCCRLNLFHCSQSSISMDSIIKLREKGTLVLSGRGGVT